ncbi:TonB-dependent receptor [Novosphingobium sp.]|uniref:TonB-dependent receptor n=1 Tax=Novosphingobium sp. TaxID=1874826 RepID=UPI0028A852C7|nr:TonB-dependent receptor [Novosphingobium sp.]
MHYTSRFLPCSAMAMVFAGLTTNVSAQTATTVAGGTKSEASPPTGGGDIVVTAQRRNQSIRDVPVTIAAFAAEDLRDRQITNAIDVAKITPGVTAASNTGGQAAAFSIRGVTLSDFNDGSEAPVAVYVDDGYIPTVQAQSFAMFDIDHVEVLKGPQGTLFGRNSTGGLVNFVIAKPTETMEGFVNATYGSYNQAKVEGAISGPIAENVQARASVIYNREDGWLKNDFPGAPDLGGFDTFATRLQLQSQLSDRLTARVSGLYFKQDMSMAPYNSIGTAPIRDSSNRVVGGYYTGGPNSFGYTPPPTSAYRTSTDFYCSRCTGMKIYDGALHLTYDLGETQIYSVTDYIHIAKRLKLDAEVSPINYLGVAQNGQTGSFTQELRATGKIDNLVWNAGAYYLNILVDTQGGYLARANSIYARNYPGYEASGIDLANVAQLRKQSGSVFAQVEYEFVPTLTFVAGGRFIHERAKFDFVSSAFRNDDNDNLDTQNYLFTVQPSYSNRISNNFWTGKAGLNWKPSDDLLVYASVNRGVRGRGFNNKLPAGPALTPAQILYKPETLVSYEGGFKFSLDRLLTVDAAVYHYDYKNYQAFLFVTAGGYIQNADATTNGGEVAVTLRPVQNLELSVGGSYNHSTVHDLPIAPGITRDVTPTFAPRRQLTASASYKVPDVMGGELAFGGNVTSSSSFFTNARNFDSQKLNGYTLVDGRITWRGDSGFSLTAAINNLFDKRYAITEADLSTLCGCTEIAYGRPRTWSLTAGYRF